MGLKAFEKTLRSYGPSQYWPMIEDGLGNSVIRESIIGHNAAIISTVGRSEIVPPMPGAGVLRCDVVNKYVLFPTTYDDSTYTWLAWHYSTQYGVDGVMIFTSMNVSGDYVPGYPNATQVYHNAGTVAVGPTTLSIPPTSNKWQLQIMTRDSSNVCRQYLDGRNAGTVGTMSASMSIQGISYYSSGSYPQYHPYGYVGPCAHWTRCLSDTEIFNLYTQAMRPDASVRRRLRVI